MLSVCNRFSILLFLDESTVYVIVIIVVVIVLSIAVIGLIIYVIILKRTTVPATAGISELFPTASAIISYKRRRR